MLCRPFLSCFAFAFASCLLWGMWVTPVYSISHGPVALLETADSPSAVMGPAVGYSVVPASYFGAMGTLGYGVTWERCNFAENCNDDGAIKYELILGLGPSIYDTDGFTRVSMLFDGAASFPDGAKESVRGPKRRIAFMLGIVHVPWEYGLVAHAHLGRSYQLNGELANAFNVTAGLGYKFW